MRNSVNFIRALWTIQGSQALPPAARGRIIPHIAKGLANADLAHFHQDGHRLCWRQRFSPFAFRRDWDLMGGIDSGDVAIEADGRLRYAFGFSQVAGLCAVASIFAGLFMASDATSSVQAGILWGGIAMFWLFGTNYIVTFFQIRRMLKKAIETAAR